MKYQTILFDLDGTISASEEGITKSMQAALSALGIHEEISSLSHFIGPPLNVELAATYHMDSEDIHRCISTFRARYETIGYKEAHLYPGIRELLKTLSRKGARLAIASSKPHETLLCVAKHFGLTPYFCDIRGSHIEDELANKTGADNKAGVIRNVLSRLEHVTPSETVMIGDSRFDITGAAANGIPSIAVTYGYGKEKDLLAAHPTHIAHSVSELQRILLS